MMDLIMSREIKVGSAILLSIAALAALGLVVWLYRRDTDALRLMYAGSIKKRDISDAARNVIAALGDLELQAQDYVLTGETVYSEAYKNDVRSYQDESGALEIVAVHDPATPLVRDLLTAGTRTADEVAAVMSVYEKNGRDAALDRIRKSSGIVYLNEARAALTKLQVIDYEENTKAIFRTLASLRHLMEAAVGYVVLVIAGAVLLIADTRRKPA
jgi:CHASE3 domain sensor protein